MEHVGIGTRRGLELWSLGVACILGTAFAFYSAKLAFQSWDFNDISTGNDATPLWIPQLSMAIGTVILLIALVDELALELRGRRVVLASDEATRNE